MSDVIESFSPPVRTWFRGAFGEPTPPQREGWPPIQRGEHTLIFAPTGSGKTLAAFLWGIDRLYETASEESGIGPGVRLLYVSPLKALNNDIERNLRSPLHGIRQAAASLGRELPPLSVAVRTGDTPGSARAKMARRPPHILITTPESLYILLTSPKAREMFREVRTVIVDEIHTMCGGKRGVHLSLSLERLVALAKNPVQRIGLSATQHPLDEVARFLGGQEWVGGQLLPRPVAIVDTGYRKPLDLEVVTVVDDFRELPGDTVWPAVIPRLAQEIGRHRTTLIFCNNRTLAERTADRINAQMEAEATGRAAPGSSDALPPDGIAGDRGIFAMGAGGPIRAHHGSTAKEARREMEEDLKAGLLPALVGTGSLELGIDIGAVDLVIQLQSPKSVAQGLQRVGRSGHLVGQTSVGRIYATFREDLMEAAAVARGMLNGDIEPTHTPKNPLDVLAQQIVALVSVEDWEVPALHALVRQTYAYAELSRDSLDSVLEMLAGKYAGSTFREFRPRIAWDRAHERVSALPGSRLLAITNAGTIPDTGAFGAYLADGKTKLGELDEEFVYETRPGDVFLLGSHVWRVREITDDRVIVEDASGRVPRMPFWNGDYPWRPYELGLRIGRSRREIAWRIEEAGDSPARRAETEAWLRRTYALDERSARNLLDHVGRQLEAVGVLSSDRTIVVESFEDAVGDSRVVIHSPFGGRINGAWALALSGALSERVGVTVETQVNDDGILFRFPAGIQPPIDLVQGLTSTEARERILRELPNSAVFGAQFRKNAARALLLPKVLGNKRTPFWLQRLKAKDLLAAARQFEDFPLVAETYRDCLRDVFDLPHLEEVFKGIETGEIRVVPVESVVPSPVASALLFNFISVYMYEWDAPKAERQLQALALKRESLEVILKGIELADLLKPEAVVEVETRVQHRAPGYRARSREELVVILTELGDVTGEEIVERCVAEGSRWVAELAEAGRVLQLEIPTPEGPVVRWVPQELAAEYRTAFERTASGDWKGAAAAGAVLERFMRTSGPVTREAISKRYGFPTPWLDQALAGLADGGEVARGRMSPGARQTEFCDRRNLEQIHRRTLSLLRKEAEPVALSTYAEFLTRWQRVRARERLSGKDAVKRVLRQLDGVALPATIWERDVLPGRLEQYRPEDLDGLFQQGHMVWVGSGKDPRRGRVRLFFRGEGNLFLSEPEPTEMSGPARSVYEFLQSEGASFATDLRSGLDLSSLEIEKALTELAMAGAVTGDSAPSMREVLSQGHGPESRGRAPLSALEADLGSRLDGRARGTGARYKDAKRRAASRARSQAEKLALEGRWSLLRSRGVLGRAHSQEERAEKRTRQLLARYGVIARDILALEDGGGEWPWLYAQLQRMEMRGEVRRGYFVEGLSGAQFALPGAVEKLRAAGSERGEPVVLNAADPANLFGSEAFDAGFRDARGRPLAFARVPSSHCVLIGGRPVLVAEDHGKRLTTLEGIGQEISERALRAYLGRPNPPNRVVVSLWNGEPVLTAPGREVLAAVGFYVTPQGMELRAAPAGSHSGTGAEKGGQGTAG